MILNDNLIEELKKSGCRLTSQRKEIISLLNYKPLTILELADKSAKRKIILELSSIYRTISLLKKLNLISEIEFGDGKKRYEITGLHNNHHHHLICNKCGEVDDVIINEENIVRKISADKNFLVLRHNFEFFGLCWGCR